MGLEEEVCVNRSANWVTTEGGQSKVKFLTSAYMPDRSAADLSVSVLYRLACIHMLNLLSDGALERAFHALTEIYRRGHQAGGEPLRMSGRGHTVTQGDAEFEFPRLFKTLPKRRRFVFGSAESEGAKAAPPRKQATPSMEAARDALLARLRAQPAQNVDSWTRDELYEDEL